MKPIMHKIGLMIALLWIAHTAIAQIDTEFWFAAPDVASISQGHADRPIFLRIASTNATTVTVDQPANTGFTPIVRNIAANAVESIDLTAFIDNIETRPFGQAQNKGLRIISTEPITVYYEVLALGNPPSQNFPLNPEIFFLKGRNALGTEFFIPSQNFLSNSFISNGEDVSIIATEDNTIITFNMRAEAVGSPNYQPNQNHQIILNRGQVFSIREVSGNASFSFGGSRIIANKPIAVTSSDDSVDRNGSQDLIGDQIFPVNLCGKEYIVPRFLTGAGEDRIYIVPTVNNTQISVNGSNIGTFNAGAMQQIQPSTATTYINATQSIYVMHLTGYRGAGSGIESASAIVPSIEGCAGTSQVQFFKTTATNEEFNVIVLVRNGAQSNFTVNGNATTLVAGDFSVVPNTGNQWVYAIKDLRTLTPNANHLVSNSASNGLFHLAILNAYRNTANIVGASYAFFSNISQLNITGILGADRSFCEGSSITLDAGAGRTSYKWFRNGVEIIGQTGRTLVVTQAGTYRVEVVQAGCDASDEVVLTTRPLPTVDLGNDRIICPATSTTLDAGAGIGRTFRWFLLPNTTTVIGTNPTLSVNQGGTYRVEVTLDNCISTDDIVVTIATLPTLNISLSNQYCVNDTDVPLQATPTGGSFTINGQASNVFSPTNLGVGTHTVVYNFTTTNNCPVSLSRSIEVLARGTTQCPLPPEAEFFIPDAFTPNADGRSDRFLIQGKDITDFNFRIFDRFGNLVFENNNFNQMNQIGWDGTKDGAEQPAGVYMWQLSGRLNNQPLTFKGQTKGYLRLLR